MSNQRPMIDYRDGAWYVRRSAITQAGFCPGSVALSGHEGYVDGPSPESLFGTVVHLSIEMADWVDVDTIEKALAADGVTAEQVGIPLDSSSGYWDAFIDEANRASEAWLDQVAPRLPQASSLHEVRYQRRVGQVELLGHGAEPVYVTGTVDLAAPELNYMADWKTSGKGWPKRRELREDQPLAYPWLAEMAGEVTFDFWVWDRTEKEWEQRRVVSTEAQRDAYATSMAATAVQLARAVDEGRNLPFRVWSDAYNTTRNWYCSPKWCGAWNICPAKGQMEREDLLEIRTIGW